jgi:hypothetical protein
MKYSKTKIAVMIILLASGFYQAITNPSHMDCVNGIVHGLVFYALFCVEDPKPKKQEG